MHLDEIILVPIILILAFSLVVPMGDQPENLASVSPTPITCPVTSTRTYNTCATYPGPNGHPTPPAAQNYDINPFAMRGYTLTSGAKNFINLTPQPDDDPNAPQLYYVLNKTPTFNNLYKINRASWDPPTLLYDVHLVGLASKANDPVMVPDVNIGFSCAEVLVLYADQNNITLKYTPDDTVTGGYTVHISDICVDPALLSKYQSNSVSRLQLPALNGKEVLGKARGSEVKVAIRDSGTFMDPRSKKDWWQRP